LPELPEVETVAAGLRPALVGRTIRGCDVRFPGMVRHPTPEHFAARATGRRILAVDRRGKYILLRLDDAQVLVVHLGMTGQLRCVDPATPAPAHLHVVFALDDGCELRYRDPRRFGRLLLGTEEELLAERKLPHLGPEPLDDHFSAGDLYRRLRARTAPIKALLLDQRIVAGVGNIYADESCFRSRIRPDRPAGTLSRRSVGRLRDALHDVIGEAIANRGSTVIDYRDAWGEIGGHQDRLLVYGRGGEPCARCGRPLRLTRIGGRSTVYCGRCQR
jgi:formamidopyrimidine-DNA glycosylase